MFTSECRAGNVQHKLSLDALVVQLRPALDAVYARTAANQEMLQDAAATKHAHARDCARAHAAIVDSIQNQQARLRQLVAAFHEFSSAAEQEDR